MTSSCDLKRPPAPCAPGMHRWQNGQCISCGLAHSGVHHERDAAIARAVENAMTEILWHAADWLKEHEGDAVAARFEAEFLEGEGR